MTPLFDTDVQELKYKVLREVASLTLEDRLTPQNTMTIAERIIPDDAKPTMRCCIYKERAIINQRVKLALGGDARNPNVVEVLPIACDECPVDGITVTQACRGCIAHHCMNACPKDAIRIVNRHATIDKDKCVECGRCAQACPYGAILRLERPCIKACKTKAISIDPDTQKAKIKLQKCVSCGACVYQCPFGAISDKSFITKAIEIVKNSFDNKVYHTYAVVAPSIGAQYANITAEQVYEGILKLGFYRVEEAAWGADAVAYHEAQELVEKGFLTSSCCPAFVSLAQKNYPAVAKHVSHNPSPMAMMAQAIRKKDPTAEIVFIGPCIAKKYETLYTQTKNVVDCAITFLEMQAWFDAAGVDLHALQGVKLTSSSSYGRGFARCGGLGDAVAEAIKEMGNTEFELKAVSCNGLSECNAALLKASKGVLKENFIEGMACDGGCIGGPACLSHSQKNKLQFAKYEKMDAARTITDAIGQFDMPDNG